ncbi:FtsX-like permease family protein [Roseivirga ehrenbergii]|nr:ABC transporter permease [Roseivirga ehrenbergii]TCL13912.1 FtsX-like permease family protein [Roseivirga ehrenbergii]
MLRNYIKSAFTNLKRNTGYTLLMIFSLALGMYCFVMAGLYVRYEYSRNLNHANADRVYRVMLDYERYHQYISADMVAEMPNVSPDIEAVNVINSYNGEVYLSKDDQSFIRQAKAFYTDANVFDVFSFPLKYGNPENALEGTGKIVISSFLSERLFPNENPIGMEVLVHEKGAFLISGVLEEVSELSILNPGIFFSMDQFVADTKASGDTDALLTHILLKEGADINRFKVSLLRTAQTMVSTEGLKGIYTEKLADAYWGNSHYDYGAQFYSLFGASKKMIKTILYVSIGVLLCAFLGYVAIALSLSLKRAKEVGVRKVNGANVSTIRIQFLVESVVYAAVSLLLTVVALEVSGKWVSDLLQVPIGLQMDQPEVIVFLIAFTLFTGLIAGLYPAFIVSKLNPVKVLSGFSSPTGSGFVMKRVLLTAQFVITICLVFGVYVLKLQVSEMAQFDNGYTTENILSFDNTNPEMKKNSTVLLESLRSVSGVVEVAKGPFPLNFNGFSKVKIQMGDSLIQDNPSRIFVSENFFETMGIKLLEGGSFNGVSDENSCLINESFAAQHGLASPLGMTLSVDGKPRTVIGVVSNYADWGVSNPTPMSHVFLPAVDSKFHSYLLKISDNNQASVMAQLETVWKTFDPVKDSRIYALSDRVQGSVQKVSKISTLFSILAGVVLLLSFMNLFGMAIMFANSKMKAVSIRKILGASVPELLGRLSLPFLYSLIIALLIALPIGYYLMEQYLQDYAVRISLNAGQGLIAGVFMIVLLFVVIGFKMLQFSKTNPVEVLRKE